MLKIPAWENVRLPSYLNNIIEKIKVFASDKKKLAVLAIGIAGILLILLSSAGGAEPDGAEIGLDEYKLQLEDELKALCESIEGAGKCRVSVSFSEGEKLEYKGSNIIRSEPPRVLGVTVVCEGGDDFYIRNSISDCMTALFDIGSNRVCVLKMK